MPTVQIKTHLSIDELLKVVEQLSSSELQKFVYRVIALRSQRTAPSLPKRETELLLKINQSVPSDIQARYNELIAKRQSEKLTSVEHRELLRLTNKIEKLEARRMEWMAQLARLRKTSLNALMKELGIQPPAYA
jgi:hypothetical protein